MKRQAFYWIISFIVYGISAYIIGQYFTHDIIGGIFCAIPCFIIGMLMASAADGYLSSRYPGFLYTPYEDKVKMAIARKTKRDSEESKILGILENELLYPYTSLSRKYKLISDFCYEHPKLIKRLKKSDRYITWRTDVIDWAKDNIDRVESFNFNDGICDYIFDASVQTQGIVDLKAKYNTPQEMDYSVICDVEIKNKRVPKDYFEFPGLVWEDEQIEVDDDDYGNTTKRSKASDALALGIGIGIVNGLTGDSVFGGGSNGN